MATKKRVSRKTFQNVSLEEAQKASQTFAITNNKLSKIEAKLNEEINKTKAKYQDQITELMEELEEPQDILETYAKEQKENWGKKKSFELLHAVIGFRTGTPKVDKDKKFTWEAVLALVKKYPVFKPFIRSTEEINKEAILAEKDDKTLAELKDKCFIKVTQDEKFFVEPKVEELVPA